MALFHFLAKRFVNSCKYTCSSLEQVAKFIDFFVKLGKTQFMSFKQYGAHLTLSEKPLKLVNQLILLGSSITSTKMSTYISVKLAQLVRAVEYID